MAVTLPDAATAVVGQKKPATSIPVRSSKRVKVTPVRFNDFIMT